MDTGIRQTGRSYRTILGAAFEASSRPGGQFVTIFPTQQIARHHFNTLKEVLSPVRGCTFKKGLVAHLPNGSWIKFVGERAYLDRQEWLGRSDDLFRVIWDHAV